MQVRGGAIAVYHVDAVPGGGVQGILNQVGARPDDPDSERRVRILKAAVVVGGVGFALGFFGPMIRDPSSGNGPMLGIFITGPIGFVAGLLWGLWRHRRGRHG